MAPPLAPVPDLDRELDALYDLPLEEFTRVRNDLAGRLRKAHQADAADQIRGLKKPTIVAWAANRLARDEPKLTAALLDAGERLRKTQQRGLAGKAKPDEVADAAYRERVLADLESALAEAGVEPTPPILEELRARFRSG